MTLDEAIKHCEEKAKELSDKAYSEYGKSMTEEEAYDCNECAREHEQLAKWLKELKAYKESSKGDLISRDALKKCAISCQIHNGALTDLCVPLYQIDNAPTVEYPQERREADKSGDLISREALYNEVDTWGCNDYDKYDFLDAIDNAPTVEQRPQGEWKLDDTEQFCYCSNCEDTYYPRPLDPSWYYCPYCGADMRGDKNGKS